MPFLLAGGNTSSTIESNKMGTRLSADDVIVMIAYDSDSGSEYEVTENVSLQSAIT